MSQASGNVSPVILARHAFERLCPLCHTGCRNREPIERGASNPGPNGLLLCFLRFRSLSGTVGPLIGPSNNGVAWGQFIFQSAVCLDLLQALHCVLLFSIPGSLFPRPVGQCRDSKCREDYVPNEYAIVVAFDRVPTKPSYKGPQCNNAYQAQNFLCRRTHGYFSQVILALSRSASDAIDQQHALVSLQSLLRQ
jgi:hypothetical protein